MPQNQNNTPNTPVVPPEIAAAMARLQQHYSQLPQTAPPSQDQQQEAPGQTIFAQSPMGTVAMPMSGSPVDLGKVRAEEAPITAGPYGANPQGENQTADQYQRMYQSPYMFPLAGALGRNHPRLGGALDNALLVGGMVKPPVDASGNPIAAGAGYGISSVFNAMRAAPEARLAYRQQLEAAPVQYETAQAQLEQERAKALAAEGQAAHFVGQNAAQILSQQHRGEAAAGIGANERAQAAQQKNDLDMVLQYWKGRNAVDVANIRAKATTDAAKIRSAAQGNKQALTKLNGLKQTALADAQKYFAGTKPNANAYFQGAQDPEYKAALSAWKGQQASRGADMQQWYNRMAQLPPDKVVDYSTYAKDRTPYGGTNAPSAPQSAPANGAPPATKRANDPLGLYQQR